MKIKELFSDKSKWTQHCSARDKNGKLTASTSSDAVCWCLSGAINKCYENSDIGKVYEILSRRGIDYIINFNDSATFEEVKALVEELDI